MTRTDFASELESAAARISDITRPDLQIMLRRAALRLRNTGQVPLDPEWEDALQTVAKEMNIPRNEIIRTIVKDWLIGHSYLPFHMVEEDGETDGEA